MKPKGDAESCAFKQGRNCRILTNNAGCITGRCPFCKTASEVSEARKAALLSINRLDAETQVYISAKYYKFKMPWKDVVKGGFEEWANLF